MTTGKPAGRTPAKVRESSLIRHTRAFYKYLADRAKPDEDGNVVAQVYLTSAFDELGISPNAQTQVRRILYESKPPCAVQVARGAGGKPSVIYLLREPQPEDFATEKRLTDDGEPAKLSAGQMKERLERLEARTAGLNIVEAMQNHERRIAKLEARLTSQGESTNGTD